MTNTYDTGEQVRLVRPLGPHAADTLATITAKTEFSYVLNLNGFLNTPLLVTDYDVKDAE